ncbi:MAG: ATP-binding protein [Bacteroidetes bacterium]|nr:ATP-binding protein [Bacteroidota bacterium]
MSWIKPNTITGSVAEGDKYFRRDEIESRIWDEILNHNHVLFLASRRVGKTSIVKYMSDNPPGSWYCKYENIQSDRSVQDFYKRLCRMTNESVSLQGKLEKLVATILSKYKIVSLGPDGIGLEHQEVNYRDLFFEILKHLKKEKQKVVLFLDEFPDVIHNIYNDHGAIQAEQLLSDMRTFRQSSDFKDVFVMVLLGSVGLNHIVIKISGRTDKVNDLHKEYLSALSLEQALNFLEHLLNGATTEKNRPFYSLLHPVID